MNIIAPIPTAANLSNGHATNGTAAPTIDLDANGWAIPDPATDVRAAAALIADGWAVCKIEPGEKRPTDTGWTLATRTPNDFFLGGYLGIMGGPASHGGRPFWGRLALRCHRRRLDIMGFRLVNGYGEAIYEPPGSQRFDVVLTNPPFGNLPSRLQGATLHPGTESESRIHVTQIIYLYCVPWVSRPSRRGGSRFRLFQW